MFDHDYLLLALEQFINLDLSDNAIASAAFAQANLMAARFFE